MIRLALVIVAALASPALGADWPDLWPDAAPVASCPECPSGTCPIPNPLEQSLPLPPTSWSPPPGQLGYDAALADHQANHTPLAILVGSASCGPCQTAKTQLAHVSTPAAYLDAEKDSKLVAKVLACLPFPYRLSRVPVLVIFDPPRQNRLLEGRELSAWIEEQSR